MDRMDIIGAWLNNIRVSIPGIGDCVIEGIRKEDGSGQSFILDVFIFSDGTKGSVYVNTGQRSRNDVARMMTAA